MPDDPTRTADPDAAATADPRLTGSAAGTAAGATAAAIGPPATTVGRYVLGEEIARGGMGAVYRATDTALAREVAVKVLLDRFGAASTAAIRFADEARITGQLQHPGIPPVHDLGILPDGRPFLAMKLIKGETLDALLASRPGPAHDRGRFVAAFEQICQAVAYAHSRRVIHRDLKPANVMVGAFGEVQVMDWGLAKVLAGDRDVQRTAGGADETADVSAIRSTRDSDGSETQAGSVLGTPAFMPPEQAVGAVDQIDARSDVFGLGAMLAVVLTGKPPFVGTDAETVRVMAARGKVEGCFSRLDACAADPGLIALCKRCLAPEPADRPADAGEVARAVADLRQAAEERTRAAELDLVRAEGERAKAETKVAEEANTRREAEARAGAERAKADEQRKRRRAQLALAAAVLLLVTGGGGAAWWQDRQSTARRVETDARDRGERERLARNAEAVAELLGQCEASLRGDDVEKARVALNAADQRAAEGGADDLADRLARCRADVDVLAGLDRFDTLWWTLSGGAYLTDQAEAARRDAFRAFGVVPGETPPDDAARRVNASAVRERLLAALDAWLSHDRNPATHAILRAADPDDFRERVRVGTVARDFDKIKELAALPEALSQPPRFAILLAQLVKGEERRTKIFLTALQRHPSSYPLLMSLGLSLPAGKPETAAERAKWYQAAAAVRPTSPAAWNNLGVALADAGEWERAVACLREAVRLDAKYARSRYNLALSLKGMGDRDGAIGETREAFRLDPKFAQAAHNLGVYLTEAEDRPGAIAAYGAALAADPKFAPAHANLGQLLKQEGNLPAAEAELREAIRLAPMKPEYQFGLGTVLTAVGDLPGAEAAYREAKRLDPDDTRARHSLGNVLLDRGQVPEALAELREANRMSPTGAAIWFDLGRAQHKSGDKRAAAAAWKEAVKYDEKYVRAHVSLAKALLDLNDPNDLDAALRHANEALRQAPKDSEAKLIQISIRLKLTVRKQERTAPPPREKRTPDTAPPPWEKSIGPPEPTPRAED